MGQDGVQYVTKNGGSSMNLKRRDVYKIVMDFRKKGLGRRKIANELENKDIEGYRNSIQNWLNGMKPILKEFEIDNKFTKETAFILGVIGPGDGYITKTNVGLAVIDKDFVIKFKACLERIYGLKCSFRKEIPSGWGNKSRYRVVLYSRNVVKDLEKYGVGFKEGNWRIPDIIKKTSKNLKMEYISAFCDSQGSIGERRITTFSKNKQGLEEMKSLFEDVGLSVTLRKNILNIYGRNSLEFFYKNIGFSIKRKQDKLFCLIKNYKYYFTSSSEINLMIPDMVKYLNLGYSRRRVAKVLNISTMGIKNRIEWGVINK